MSADTAWTIFESPLGPLTLVAGERGVRHVHFEGQAPRLAAAGQGPLAGAVEQLRAYFDGEARAFQLGLDLRGTPLQRRVWSLLLEIPYGETSSYGELARGGGVEPVEPGWGT
jgi:methylated-DNA-[protein]-cysteine S-methyltransferase